MTTPSIVMGDADARNVIATALDDTIIVEAAAGTGKTTALVGRNVTILAEGRRQAQVIMGNADAQAAKTYADSFGKDPAFYDFYRAMQSYRTTFGTDDNLPHGSSTILLSPDNDYLRQFMGRKQGQ